MCDHFPRQPEGNLSLVVVRHMSLVHNCAPRGEHLEAACEAHDRKTEARALLDAEGLTIKNRHGELRPHPGVAIERDSAIRFARMLRELGLSDEPSDSRPPRLSGRYAGRT